MLNKRIKRNVKPIKKIRTMSTKNVNGNEDYRELTACQRLLDYYEEAYKQINEAHRWAGGNCRRFGGRHHRHTTGQ